jgi:hypothetical protein
MKLTLKQLVDGNQALADLGADKTLDAKLKFGIARNIRLIQQEFIEYEKAWIELIKTKYGVENENGDFTVPPKSMSALMKEIETLQSVEVDLDIHKLDPAAACVNMSSNDIYLIDWMFEEEK